MLFRKQSVSRFNSARGRSFPYPLSLIYSRRQARLLYPLHYAPMALGGWHHALMALAWAAVGVPPAHRLERRGICTRTITYEPQSLSALAVLAGEVSTKHHSATGFALTNSSWHSVETIRYSLLCVQPILFFVSPTLQA